MSKAQISKIIQSGGFLGKILGPLLKTGFPLLKSVIKPLGLLDLTAASSAIDAGVQKKIYGSGVTILVISNEEMNDNENCSSFRGFKYFIERCNKNN